LAVDGPLTANSGQEIAAALRQGDVLIKSGGGDRASAARLAEIIAEKAVSIESREVNSRSALHDEGLILTHIGLWERPLTASNYESEDRTFESFRA
jgi:hypothetical protein